MLQIYSHVLPQCGEIVDCETIYVRVICRWKSVSVWILSVQYRIEFLRGVKGYLEEFMARRFANLEAPLHGIIIQIADQAMSSPSLINR